MTSKISATKIYLFIFNLENVIETWQFSRNNFFFTLIVVETYPGLNYLLVPVPNSSWAIPSAVSFVGLYSNRMSFSSLRGFRIRSTMFSVFWLTSTYKKKKGSIKN